MEEWKIVLYFAWLLLAPATLAWLAWHSLKGMFRLLYLYSQGAAIERFGLHLGLQAAQIGLPILGFFCWAIGLRGEAWAILFASACLWGAHRTVFRND